MVREGINIINDNINEGILEYSSITCICDKLDGRQTQWGSEIGGNITAAINYKL